MSAHHVFQASHPGVVREENEDALICRPELGLFAIADGAGGHRGGGDAAWLIARAIAAIPPATSPDARRHAIREEVMHVHDRLCQAGDAASTVAVLLLHGRSVVCLWAGDSRIYRWRAGRLALLSHDHSLVQEMLDAGLLSPAQARSHPNGNIITRAVGGGAPSLQLEEHADETEAGDRYMLCSDGLNKTIEDQEICRLLGGDGDLAQALLDAALERGARDNVSVIVIRRD